MNTKPEKTQPNLVRSGPYKLKDKTDRASLLFNLNEVFGFNPTQIIIEKVPQKNNMINVYAVEGVDKSSSKVYTPKEILIGIDGKALTLGKN